ncbi:DUF4844 domain-containing protein [Chryseolinea soli]|uniref:DUF4844 domain-containing protein n=1 Tax=Chryseolinea soli TaxID=2321403 RepID=A0A385SM27_9BACT|nr:DUF4844 domain-containing protein [Chryseolinea soli]AYB30490.1 DUF4844 domain-containing protein [Chryseolinea soli]
MAIEKGVLEKLMTLREKRKFTSADWERRGLNPSDPEVIEEMTRLTNMCLDELLADAQSDASEKQMKRILIKGLKRFDTTCYDTEEKEFIGDEFYKIGQLIGINIGDNLNDWLYGKFLGTMIRLTKKKEVIIETRSSPCTACNTPLNLDITSKQDGVPNCWIICQCNLCEEYNLLSSGEDAVGLRFGNFKSVETLDGNEHSEEDAVTRLNQIKYFRGKK